MAKVIQVIETEIRRGGGTDDNPLRLQNQYWSFDGVLLAESVDGYWLALCQSEHDELIKLKLQKIVEKPT